jgi:hypothetical protein
MEVIEKTCTPIAGEDLEFYRRWKWHTTAGEIVYADASDGDGWFGVTLPYPGKASYTDGDPVLCLLRAENVVMPITASAAVTKNAPIYPEDDGKASDDAGTVIIGTAFGTSVAAGDGSIFQMTPNGGSGSVITGSSVADSDLDGQGGIPLLFGGTVTFTAGAGLTQTLATLERKVRLVNWWLIARDTTAANIKLYDGTQDITAVKAKGTADDTIVAGSTIIAEYDELAAAVVLSAISSAECVCDVWVQVVPIA